MLPRQKKPQRIYLLETSSGRDTKGFALRSGRKTVIERGTQVQKNGNDKCLSIITLNINGLYAPIKRHRIAEWIRKHDPHMCCLQETHLKTKDLHRLNVKG